MSIVDTVLKMVTKNPKEAPTGSRSEREAKIKDKAGMVISPSQPAFHCRITRLKKERRFKDIKIWV